MNEFSNSLPIRDDLTAAIDRAWLRLTNPGTWFDGKQRLAIVAEARNASHCTLCENRSKALSANMVKGQHDDLGELPKTVIELVHRLATDSGRLSHSWYQGVLDSGISDCEYIEIVSIVNMCCALDTFNRCIGIVVRKLPEAVCGKPSRQRPVGAKTVTAWVPTVLPGDLTENDLDPYSEFHAYNIQLALGLVPQEVINFFDLDTTMYLTEDEIADLGTEKRAISRAQMELIAARGASLNGCHYCATCHTLHLHKLSQRTNTPYDLVGVLSGSTTENGIEHGELLIRFTDAVLADDETQLELLRPRLQTSLGAQGFIDAAATIASFNSIVRVANATGTQLDRLVTDQIEDLEGDDRWLSEVPQQQDLHQKT
jgi:AhpD family alkylhydroperoxidase